MLTTRRSRRKSEIFDSRFRDGTGGDFPLRQYLRCKEDLFSSVVHLCILVAFAATVAFFSRTVWILFDNHGSHLNPAYRWCAVGIVWLFVLLLVRRAFKKVVHLRDTRQEMKDLKQQIRA